MRSCSAVDENERLKGWRSMGELMQGFVSKKRTVLKKDGLDGGTVIENFLKMFGGEMGMVAELKVLQ